MQDPFVLQDVLSRCPCYIKEFLKAENLSYPYTMQTLIFHAYRCNTSMQTIGKQYDQYTFLEIPIEWIGMTFCIDKPVHSAQGINPNNVDDLLPFLWAIMRSTFVVVHYFVL